MRPPKTIAKPRCYEETWFDPNTGESQCQIRIGDSKARLRYASGMPAARQLRHLGRGEVTVEHDGDLYFRVNPPSSASFDVRENHPDFEHLCASLTERVAFVESVMDPHEDQ